MVQYYKKCVKQFVQAAIVMLLKPSFFSVDWEIEPKKKKKKKIVPVYVQLF